ncbi:MAG: hypothetical protein BWX88_01822 [Planctomycetes bacterium ADurb.Bin126]|nr:MAG: hypothetical protein BWX88_01822 [Planctomycetes bacterium ADurb.Bin126]
MKGGWREPGLFHFCTVADEASKRFRQGVALYRGREVVPFGERLHAVPMDAHWRR